MSVSFADLASEGRARVEIIQSRPRPTWPDSVSRNGLIVTDRSDSNWFSADAHRVPKKVVD